jgi:hypothetical protein
VRWVGWVTAMMDARHRQQPEATASLESNVINNNENTIFVVCGYEEQAFVCLSDCGILVPKRLYIFLS